MKTIFLIDSLKYWHKISSYILQKILNYNGEFETKEEILQKTSR